VPSTASRGAAAAAAIGPPAATPLMARLGSAGLTTSPGGKGVRGAPGPLTVARGWSDSGGAAGGGHATWPGHTGEALR